MKPSSDLRREVELLRIIWQRNRNQHRAQMWWKYFDMFLRRASQQSKAKRFDPAALKSVASLLPKFWRAMHSSLAQGAFITIIFAVMASTARIASLMGVTREAQPHAASSSASHSTGRTAKSGTISGTKSPIVTEDLGEIVGMDDLGRPLQSRPDCQDSPTSNLVPIVKTKKLKSSQHKPLKSSKKSRKPRDAIDDIFS